MVTLFTLRSCISSRKAKAWLKEHNISYIERNLSEEPLQVDEIKEMVRMTENGTDEIIATRSKHFQRLGIELDTLSLNEFYKLVSTNPFLLRSPIILDEKRLLAGFNENEIRSFLPRKVRKMYLQLAKNAANH